MKSVRFQQEFICIDIQGYTIPEFIPKEMTIINQQGDVHNYLFNSPPLANIASKYRHCIKWLDRYHHGISWRRMGILWNPTVIFGEFPSVVVYVKGHQKAQLLSRYYDNVINLEFVEGVPKYAKTSYYCTQHDECGAAWSCSYVNTKLLYDYIINNKMYN